METKKSPLASKTIWGLIVALAGTLLGWNETLQNDILQYVDKILQIIGAGLILYGRIVASTKLDWKKPLTKWPVFLTCLLIPIGASSCASADTYGKIRIKHLSHDLYIMDIGSNSQMPIEGGTSIDATVKYPIESVDTPLDLLLTRTGLLNGQSLEIDTVGGSIIIQRVLVGTQNIPLDKALSKMFLPSENPLGDIETTKVETIEN